jgi:uncharacterized protein (DUF2236 family)
VAVSEYFTDSSMIRRVYRERAMVLAGPRALLMQAAHPRAVSGLLAHSSSLEEPYERLMRTAEVMSTITFGRRVDADRATRRVRAVHRQVGADAPELLLWVLYTLVDSAIVVYDKYVTALDDEAQSALWDDYKVVGKMFALRKADMPATLGELRAYGRGMLSGDTLSVNDWARTRARQIVLEPPVPVAARPLVEAMNFVTVALLPDRIRREYGFRPLPPAWMRRALVGGGAEYVKRAVIPFLPARLRYVPAARAA